MSGPADGIKSDFEISSESDIPVPVKEPEVKEDRPSSAWRMAEQRFKHHDFELETQHHNDGYMARIEMGGLHRYVFFDPAGRVTHVR